MEDRHCRIRQRSAAQRHSCVAVREHGCFPRPRSSRHWRPSLFRNALRTTLVKRASDVKPFEELFDFFFLGIGEAIDALDRRIMEELGLTPEQFQQMLEQIQRLLKEMEGDLSDFTSSAAQDNRGELERLLRETAESGSGSTARSTVSG